MSNNHDSNAYTQVLSITEFKYTRYCLNMYQLLITVFSIIMNKNQGTYNRLSIEDLQPSPAISIRKNDNNIYVPQGILTQVEIPKFVIGQAVCYSSSSVLPDEYPAFRPKPSDVAPGPWSAVKGSKERSPLDRDEGIEYPNSASRYTTKEERQRIVEEYLYEKQQRHGKNRREYEWASEPKYEANAKETEKERNINKISEYARNTSSRMVSGSYGLPTFKNIGGHTEEWQQDGKFASMYVHNSGSDICQHINKNISPFNTNDNLPQPDSIQSQYLSHPLIQPQYEHIQVRGDVDVPFNGHRQDHIPWEQYQRIDSAANSWRQKCAWLSNQLGTMNASGRASGMPTGEGNTMEQLNTVLQENRRLRVQIGQLEDRQKQFLVDFASKVNSASTKAYAQCVGIIDQYKAKHGLGG